MTSRFFIDAPQHPKHTPCEIATTCHILAEGCAAGIDCTTQKVSSRPKRAARSGETRFSTTMPTQPTRLLLACTPLFVVAAAAILFYFPPTQYSFYPECPIHRYLGLLCPGCGTTRALSALVHGQLREALRLNPFTMLLLPVALVYGATVYVRTMADRSPLRVPNAAVYFLLAAAAVFTAVRNL